MSIYSLKFAINYFKHKKLSTPKLGLSLLFKIHLPNFKKDLVHNLMQILPKQIMQIYFIIELPKFIFNVILLLYFQQ